MWVSPPPGVGPLLFHGDGTSLRLVWRSASTPLAYEVGWRLVVTPPPFRGGVVPTSFLPPPTGWSGDLSYTLPFRGVVILVCHM